MTLRALLLVSLCFVVKSEVVFIKNCGTDGPLACQVTRVDVGGCSNAPRFCRMGHGKRYPVSVSFVPYFTSQKMLLQNMVDLHNDGAYHPMQYSKNLCEDHNLVCPLEPHVKQTLDFELHMTANLSGSAPVLVNFYNADNQTESCCFTFKIKSTGAEQLP